jgi:hypothetical protein
VRYDARFTNWTNSVEVAIDNPQMCLNVRRELLEKPLPQFSAQKVITLSGAENANQFAARVWAQTGQPTWDDTTKAPSLDTYKGMTGIRFIDRETRLSEDRANGQLSAKPDANIPPAWKP